MNNISIRDDTNWIKCEDELPPEGEYVLGRHNRSTWHDSTDQKNVNCVVVKIAKGLSVKDRQKIKDDLRFNLYFPEDEWGNNRKPYYWEEFGPDNFFGQEIYKWMPIPDED